MSPPQFNELIHAPTRLAIVALLAAVEWADFRFIGDELGLSDSALSKQLSTLESAGYVAIRKTVVAGRPRTSARLSETGRRAFDQHVAALQEMIARSQPHGEGDAAAAVQRSGGARASGRRAAPRSRRGLRLQPGDT